MSWLAAAGRVAARAVPALAPPPVGAAAATAHHAAGRKVLGGAVLGRGVLPADGARLARVLAQNAVERRPQPPRGSYLADLVNAVMEKIFGAIGLGVTGVPGWAVRLFTFGVLALALGLAGIAFWRGWRGRRSVPPAGPRIALSPVRAGGEASWDAAAWRRQRDLALADGRLAEALRATWWWLARALAGTRAEPTWTGRDLLAAAGRDDLRPLVAGLDALVYGRRGGGAAGGEAAGEAPAAPARPAHQAGGDGVAAGDAAAPDAAAGRELRRLIGRLEEALA
jgi:hypothetical protein